MSTLSSFPAGNDHPFSSKASLGRKESCVGVVAEFNDQNRDRTVRVEAGHYGAIIFVTRPTLVSPAYRLSRMSIAQ